MPLTAEGARKNYQYYVDHAKKVGDCLQYWKQAGRLPRWVYEGYHKKILPTNMHVCHSCDNPWCINIDHLWEGTAALNISDAWNKGRMFFQTERGNAIMTRRRK